MKRISYQFQGAEVTLTHDEVLQSLGSFANENDAEQFIRQWNMQFPETACFEHTQDIESAWLDVMSHIQA
jgi:hypothetical protein